jgi:iron complex outermembrane receptor protein
MAGRSFDSSRSHLSIGVRCALLGGTVLIVANAAVAETASDVSERNTIVVTGVRDKGTGAGTKTDTPLMKTPQTVTVIDADELARRNARSINQALTYVAGVSPNQRGGMVTRYDQLYLRGFAPGFFLDGMRLIAGPYSTPQIDFNRVDHVDIVKGPASVLYGNSTPGGLVNLTSKVPEPNAFQRVELSVGNYDSQLGNIDINRPLDDDGRWLFRLASGAQRFDGFTSMTESERTHFSPMLTFAPSAQTSLTLIGAYQHDPKGGGYSGVPAFGSVLPNPFGQLPEDINTGDPDYEVFDRYQRSMAAQLRHEFNDSVSLRTNARFQNTDLSYRQLYVNGFATTGATATRNTDFSTITRGGGGADEDFDTLTADASLSIEFSTGPLAHNVLTGVDYQNIDGENFQRFNDGVSNDPLTSIPNLSLFSPTYGGVMPTRDLTRLSPAYINTETEREQIGIYAQDQIEIDRLQLIASGRYDTYEQDSLNKRNGVTTPLSQHAFTMRLGALYELPMGFAPFASYSESFEPQTGNTYQGEAFDPVTGRQYEVGLKYQPANLNALFTFEAYDLRRQKVVVGHPEAGTNGIPSNAQIQIGETKVQGAELEGRGEVLPGFEIVFTGSYTDAEITQGSPASGVMPTTTGTRPLGTPVWMASTFLTYDFAPLRAEGRLGGLTVGGGVRYVGGSDGTTTYAVVNGVTQFTAFTTDSFVLVDALASYDLGRLSSALDGAEIALNVANLFDKRHVTACSFNNSCYFGASRTVLGTLRYEW